MTNVKRQINYKWSLFFDQSVTEKKDRGVKRVCDRVRDNEREGERVGEKSFSFGNVASSC